jgi:hypothetical protein
MKRMFAYMLIVVALCGAPYIMADYSQAMGSAQEELDGADIAYEGNDATMYADEEAPAVESKRTRKHKTCKSCTSCPKKSKKTSTSSKKSKKRKKKEQPEPEQEVGDDEVVIEERIVTDENNEPVIEEDVVAVEAE